MTDHSSTTDAAGSGAHTEQFRDISARTVAGTPLDAVVYADRNGIIRLWNSAAQNIFGFTEEEAVGQSLDLIIPEKHRTPHWAGWDKVLQTGHTSYGHEPLTVPGLNAAGERISLSFSITILTDGDGQIEGIAAVLHDVSEQWDKQRALRRRVRDLERQIRDLGAEPVDQPS
ncbi:PAS domain S-box protein [Corynebacterium sputi]|uniref:PAS domain S-box protein n=1 Tax=Corynebacterium sputi TaxID=489915 RepID=UPI0003FF2040|nr:PAS domain-containing protein [Corynebacterium sputi]